MLHKHFAFEMTNTQKSCSFCSYIKWLSRFQRESNWVIRREFTIWITAPNVASIKPTTSSITLSTSLLSTSLRYTCFKFQLPIVAVAIALSIWWHIASWRHRRIALRRISLRWIAPVIHGVVVPHTAITLTFTTMWSHAIRTSSNILLFTAHSTTKRWHKLK